MVHKAFFQTMTDDYTDYKKYLPFRWRRSPYNAIQNNTIYPVSWCWINYHDYWYPVNTWKSIVRKYSVCLSNSMWIYLRGGAEGYICHGCYFHPSNMKYIREILLHHQNRKIAFTFPHNWFKVKEMMCDLNPIRVIKFNQKGLGREYISAVLGVCLPSYMVDGTYIQINITCVWA